MQDARRHAGTRGGALALLVAALAGLGADEVERGRDPWVFRASFEDRTRMVLIAAGDRLWFAFNPETGALHRVWQGELEMRGKVWDFSQDNSVARGRTLYAAPSAILTLPDGALLPGWTADGVTWDDGWAFDGGGATLTSPTFSLDGWQRVFIAFDERSRRGPIRVELSTDGGATWDAQHFDSCLHVTSDDEWQWNFKQLQVMSDTVRVRLRQVDAAFAKRLRRVRIFGDRPAWYVGDEPLEVLWRGYALRGTTGGVVLEYDLRLPDGGLVHVEHEPERYEGGWSESLSLSGDATGLVRLELAPTPAGVHRITTPLQFKMPGRHEVLFSNEVESEP